MEPALFNRKYNRSVKVGMNAILKTVMHASWCPLQSAGAK